MDSRFWTVALIVAIMSVAGLGGFLEARRLRTDYPDTMTVKVPTLQYSDGQLREVLKEAEVRINSQKGTMFYAPGGFSAARLSQRNGKVWCKWSRAYPSRIAAGMVVHEERWASANEQAIYRQVFRN